jgi:hypothetical protein
LLTINEDNESLRLPLFAQYSVSQTFANKEVEHQLMEVSRTAAIRPNWGEDDVPKSHLSLLDSRSTSFHPPITAFQFVQIESHAIAHFSNVVQFLHVPPLQAFHSSHIPIVQFPKCTKSPVSSLP